ncbi:exopolysaccharide biosynthesis polyprenyl glycosylphosphotransferase [candidate division KSB1 bacterium]|nr:exopolysaccharide biosynthesis polyprenyl glycosylphosphotransferase [candidate division KSB1 bacterium]
MLSEREKFLGHIMKGLDWATGLVAFPCAYYIDEIIRTVASLNVKAYAIGPTIGGFVYFASNYWPMLIGFPLIWIMMMSVNGIYIGYRTLSFRKMAWLLFVSSVWAAIASGSLVFLMKLELASRLFFSVYTITAFLLLLLQKRIVLILLDLIHSKGYNQENLLIVGTGARAREFIQAVRLHSNWGLRIAGLIDDEHGMYGKKVEGYPVIGRIQDIRFLVNHLVIDRVIFVVPRLWLERIEEAILSCEEVGIPTALSLDLYNLHIAHTYQTDFNGFPLLEFETFHAKPWQLFIKRFIDIVISLVALILFAPLMLLVAILIKLTSNGPVFFKQTRVGLKGRKFTLYKFRSMVTGAEQRKDELLENNEMDGPVFKMKRDPRITPLGHFLRRTSIDELPQFFNTFNGDMSIVGPRPPLPSEVENYEIWQRRRLSLKPGITCIWQVSGRNKISFTQWMKMDMEYIDNWSLGLDFKILLRTFLVVLSGYGAE